jgi:DNA polymerase I
MGTTGLDTETHLIGPGNVIPRLVCVSYTEADGTGVVHSNADAEAHHAISRMLADAVDGRSTIIIQNAAFDVTVLLRYAEDIINGSQQSFGGKGIDMAHAWRSMIWDILENNLDRELNDQPLLLSDTVLREKLYALSTTGVTEGKFSLMDLTAKYLNIDLSFEKADPLAWRMRYSELDGISASEWVPEAYNYAAMDAVYAKAIWEIQEGFRQDRGEGSMRSEALQIYADVALRIATSHGFLMDPAQVTKIADRMEAEVTPAKLATLTATGILRSNGSIDTKALKDEVERVCMAQGITPVRTDKGAISTADDVLSSIPQLSKPLAEYQHRQEFNKILTAFLPNLKHPVVYANYDVLKETGRTSSHGNGKRLPAYPAVNIQQMPRQEGIRECYVARPGYVLVSTDYSALELCSVGQVTYSLFGHSVHRERVNQGYDMHSYLGSAIAGLSERDLVGGFEPGTDGCYRSFMSALKYGKLADPSADYIDYLMSFKPADKVWEPKDAVKARGKHYRTLAKPTGLGYPGMLGPKTFVDFARATYGVEVSIEEAESLRNFWRETYPESADMKAWVEEQKRGQRFSPELNKDIDTYGYTTKGYDRFRAGATYNAAANGTFMQSLSADGAKLAVAWTTRAMCGGLDADNPYRILEGCRLLAFIHDELITEIPDDEFLTIRALAISHLQCLAMSDVMPDIRFSIDRTAFPDPDAKPSVEPAAMRRWSKAAEPVWEEHVWDPYVAMWVKKHFPEVYAATQDMTMRLIPWTAKS